MVFLFSTGKEAGEVLLLAQSHRGGEPLHPIASMHRHKLGCFSHRGASWHDSLGSLLKSYLGKRNCEELVL